MQEMTDRIVTLHREMEATLQTLRKQSLDLEAAHKAEGIGSLEIKKTVEEARALTGRIAGMGVISASLPIEGHKTGAGLPLKMPPLATAAGVNLLNGGDR